ncbi:MAG TPA: T9SS type A sorting domain-containing protein, partial [Bacteroidia bacterium]|nr:T9SS type A sorting domain-containing protein [Bacteroidia bacterium]
DVGGGASSYTGATTVSTFTTFNNELIVGGNLDSLGFAPASYIGKWDGTTWTTLGSGTNNTVLALATLHDTLYAGGLFPVAGGNPTPFIAKWIPGPASFISAENSVFGKGEFILYPNPVLNHLYIKNDFIDYLKNGETYSFVVFDITGRTVYKTTIVKNEILFDRDKISSGLYIFKITDNKNNIIQQGKLSFR